MSVVRDVNKTGIEHARQCFAVLLHDSVMVPLEEWASKQSQQIHPDWRQVYLPLEAYDGHGTLCTERPVAIAFYITAGNAFDGSQRHDMDNVNVESEAIW